MPITGTRQFAVNGPCLVKVKGRGTLFDKIIPDGPDEPDNVRFNELGLTSEQILISYVSHHRDLLTDDFGPQVPAEILVQLAECRIQMTLIHYDPYVLQACLSESMGGAYDTQVYLGDSYLMPRPEMMFAANRPLGGGVPVLRNGCHYIELYITSPYLATPWMFPTSYIIHETKIPLGTETSKVDLIWRSIPYKSQYRYAGANETSGVPLFVSGTYLGQPTVSGYLYQETLASGTLVFDRYNQNLFLQINGFPPSGTNISGEVITD